MISLRNILSRFHIVVANFEQDGNYSMLQYQCRYRKGTIASGPPEEITAQDKIEHSIPLLLYVSGYGVICKPAEQATQIVGESSKFISTHQKNGTICFVRKSQISLLLERLGSSLLHTGCVGNDLDVISLGKEYYNSQINVKSLFCLGTMGSQLSLQLYKKIKLPILITVLGTLLLNFAVGGAVEKKCIENHALLMMLQHAKGRQDELTKQGQDMLNELSSGINSGFAYLSDCIGSAVPDSVILNNLTVQPPVKRIEEGKPFHVETHKVVIKGESINASDISLFVSRLKNMNDVRDLKISSVGQSRDGQTLHFVIEIEV